MLFAPLVRMLRTVSLCRGMAVCVTLGFAAPAQAEDIQTSEGPLQLTQVAQGFDVPWGLGLLPGGGSLVTERDGRLLFVENGTVTEVKGVPRVAAQGQGGLLDVLVPHDFSSHRVIFWSYSKRVGHGATTAVARGKLSRRNTALTDVRDIFVASPASTTGRHFGSRLAEGPDGAIYVTIGDRGDRPSAQEVGSHNGSVVRINPDGSVPRDNPLVGRTGAQPEIWSYGHRNPQGLAFDTQGRLWSAEHGARGGDEINLIGRGLNYGWPVIAYGRHYSGLKIGEGTSRAGMEQPIHYWDPSIAPSNLLIYSGKMWPGWRGDILVGSLKFDYIARLSGTPLTEVEQIKSDETGRIRDIEEAADGSIWFLSETEGALYRLSR
ncbi:Soluble aldose sugar dehydrogenase YliI precursor [Phaeobacter italicus]|uniref:Soluble aldose sugar dehydrogenase YliI n=1 Tax=Phaeobacter italicus TaxID=481446 RepID=A0A0H5CYH4_9RHOB|nr:PQQ-dependent sugar dehydrogenase [Phaeobacter italicus]CRL09849.1 Soluble aldose sugar dehydrogenase YliI precursor [Phaeobacter italicus]